MSYIPGSIFSMITAASIAARASRASRARTIQRERNAERTNPFIDNHLGRRDIYRRMISRLNNNYNNNILAEIRQGIIYVRLRTAGVNDSYISFHTINDDIAGHITFPPINMISDHLSIFYNPTTRRIRYITGNDDLIARANDNRIIRYLLTSIEEVLNQLFDEDVARDARDADHAAAARRAARDARRDAAAAAAARDPPLPLPPLPDAGTRGGSRKYGNTNRKQFANYNKNGINIKEIPLKKTKSKKVRNSNI